LIENNVTFGDHIVSCAVKGHAIRLQTNLTWVALRSLRKRKSRRSWIVCRDDFNGFFVGCCARLGVSGFLVGFASFLRSSLRARLSLGSRSSWGS
jgi:hypothetical protein